jgi:hypothetical protein
MIRLLTWVTYIVLAMAAAFLWAPILRMNWVFSRDHPHFLDKARGFTEQYTTSPIYVSPREMEHYQSLLYLNGAVTLLLVLIAFLIQYLIRQDEKQASSERRARMRDVA